MRISDCSSDVCASVLDHRYLRTDRVSKLFANCTAWSDVSAQSVPDTFWKIVRKPQAAGLDIEKVQRSCGHLILPGRRPHLNEHERMSALQGRVPPGRGDRKSVV